MHLSLPRWFAHRGGGSLAPENTLAGIRLAAQLGYRAVEFDVMLSGDGTPVLIHDETLDRTTNGHGPVSNCRDAELFALDAGAGEHIPRFADAACLCRTLNLLANVEIKPAEGLDEPTAEAVVDQALAQWHGAPVFPLLSSFSLTALDIAARRAPQLPRGVLFDQVPPDWLEIVRSLGACTLHCNAIGLTDTVLAQAADAGVPVLCYTVNRKNQANSLFRRGVRALFTDRLDCWGGETTAYKGLHLGG